MADTGVPLNAGVGGPIADTETNAGRSNWQMQRVKIVAGDLDADQGDASFIQKCLEVTAGGKSVTSITASGLIKTGAGILRRVLITVAMSTAGITFYDGTSASGTVIGFIPSTGTVNGVPYVLDLPFTTGLYASYGASGTGTVTVSYD